MAGRTGVQVFEGRVVRGDPAQCGHIIQASAGSGASRQVVNYSTERIVGNGSFGVVFQATCLETGNTVRAHRPCLVAPVSQNTQARAAWDVCECAGR